MKDMVPKGTGNSRFMKSSIPANITHEELVALLRAGTFPYDLGGLNPDGIATQGTPLNKSSLLRDETAAAFFGGAVDKTPDDIFQLLKTAPFERYSNLVYQEFEQSTQWTAPSNVAGPCQILCCGGGGGNGGACSVTNSGGYVTSYGGYGGSGNIEIVHAVLIPGTTYEVVIGTAGEDGTTSNGAPNAPTDGSNGGTTSFGALCSAAGGDGGHAAVNQYTPGTGGNGGAGGGGGYQINNSYGTAYYGAPVAGGNGQFGGAGGGGGGAATPGPYGTAPGGGFYKGPIPFIILPPISVLWSAKILNSRYDASSGTTVNSGGGGIGAGGGGGSSGGNTGGYGGGGGGFFSDGSSGVAGGYLSYGKTKQPGVVAIWYYTK